MTVSIGSLYSTKIPSLDEIADIQEALRVYHYGASSGSGIGQYDVNNTDPELLENPSIAYSFHDLQTQIDTITAASPVPLSAFTVKGSLLVGTGASTYVQLPVGSDGFVLTANSGTASGLEWSLPSVTPTNAITLTNKTLTSPIINISFNQQAGTSYTVVLSDNSKMLEFSSSSSVSVIIPKNATAAIPIGSQISLLRVGTGQVTVVPEDGTVTINSSLGLKLRAQWSGAVLTKRATNLWVLNGDTSV